MRTNSENKLSEGKLSEGKLSDGKLSEGKLVPWRSSPATWCPNLVRRRCLQVGLRVGLSLLLSGGLVGLGSCARPAIPSIGPPIRVGILDSLTGDDAASGRATVEAAKLATQEVNETGGLQVGKQKRPVELVIKDAQSKPDTAVSEAQLLINQEAVVAIVGPQYSRYAIPVSRLAEQAQIPMISPRSTNPKTTAGKRYVFRAIFIDPLQGDAVAQFACDILKAKRAAVLYDIASPYNQGMADVFRQVFTQLGGEVVAFESYTTGKQTFTTQLKRIRDRNPEVLFLPNYANEVPIQAKQARQLGIKATLLGADAWGGMKAADRQWVEGAYFSDHYVPGANAVTRKFISRYRQAYGSDPGANAAATYDSMGLLFEAIERQGSTDPEAIRQGIANFGPYRGVTGTLEYRGTGDPIVSVAILQIKNRQVVFYRELNP